MTLLRWAGVGVVVLALVFAIQGGEYTTGDWITLKRDAAEELRDVNALKAAIDSLQALVVLVEKDPAEQERIAREEFGMIRPGEFLYRLVPDSGQADEK